MTGAAATARGDTWIPPRVSPLRRVTRLPVRVQLAVLVIVAAAVCAIFATQLAPASPAHASLTAKLRAPQWLGHRYVLGTDEVGRDELSRLLYGLRTSLVVGVLVVAIGAGIGVTLGILAGYFGSFTELVIMRLVDFQMSIPGILLIMILAYLIGPGLRTTILVLGVTGWVQYARMAHAPVRVVTNQAYVEAARTVGCRPWNIVLSHVLPNVADALIILGILQFGQAIIVEASISYLGFGIQPPSTSLGSMISSGRPFIELAWWPLILPSAVLFAIVFAVNICGDAIHNWLDPRERHTLR